MAPESGGSRSWAMCLRSPKIQTGWLKQNDLLSPCNQTAEFQQRKSGLAPAARLAALS